VDTERRNGHEPPDTGERDGAGNPAAGVPYNDIDLRRWKEYSHIETDSLWHIPARERANGHRLEYHGNFVPQIATQILLRYSKERELVLDLFLGCGTSAIEAVRLHRNCLGVELQSDLCEHVAARLPEALAAGRLRIIADDSTRQGIGDRLRQEMRAAWGQDAADLLILHPPYADIIRFSDDAADLSNRGSTAEFLAGFRQAVAHGYEILRPGRFAALVIGDKYTNGELVPLGFFCLQQMVEAGFRTKSIIVKNIEGNEIGKGRTSNLWRYRALRGGFYIFKHEYVMLFQKPAARRSRAADTFRDTDVDEDAMSKTLYEGQYFSLLTHESGDEFVRTGDEVLIVPVTAEGDVLLAVEPSPAFGEPTLVLPGGELEAHEAVEVTANRELQEEIGYRAERIDALGELRPFSKYLTVRSFVFLARDLVPSRLEGDEKHQIHVERVPFADFETLIAAGRLLDARVIAALYRARSFLLAGDT
jgi:DNA modification methylase/8-oxo-dGTP pyrophosphatase MutT (NUDIX family)